MAGSARFVANWLVGIRSIAIILSALLATHAHAGELREAYVDRHGNVHVVGTDGKDVAVTDDGRAMRVRIAPNGKFVVWLVRDYTPGDAFPRAEASMFGAYDGAFAGFVDCEYPIRRVWFWNDGDKIGVECGRKDAAGTEQLYESATLQLIESFDRSKTPTIKRPQWSRTSEADRD